MTQMTFPHMINIANLFWLAVGLNIPLGMLRAPTKPMSAIWFFYIHASIPFIILARTALGFDWHFIPLTLCAAIFGQMAGKRLARSSNG